MNNKPTNNQWHTNARSLLAYFLLLTSYFSLFTPKAFAQQLTLPGGNTIQGWTGFKFNKIGDIVTAAIPFAFAAAGIGLLFMIIIAGFDLMTSAGDTKKMEMGKQRLTYGIIGFILIFVAYWLVQIVGYAFGLTEIQNTFQ